MLKIVLIDPDISVLQLVKKILESSGNNCRTFTSGEELISEIKSTRFDLVISEWKLPNISGEDLCKTIIKKLTATPFRMDGGSLIGGEKSLFDGVGYEVPMRVLIERGYITPLTAKEGIAHIETKNLATAAGDFKASDQEREFHKNDLTNKAVKQVVKLGKDRKGWMIFCSKVEHAQEVADILNDDYEIPTKCVHGDLSIGDREEALNDFKAQKTRCLVSVGVLTTGFNAKHVDLIGR